MGRKRNIAMETVARPMFRGAITVLIAVAWFIGSIFIFQVYLPMFGYYKTLIANEGTTTNDVWFIWAWIPTILVLVIGIFWSSGIINKVAKAVSGI